MEVTADAYTATFFDNNPVASVTASVNITIINFLNTVFILHLISVQSLNLQQLQAKPTAQSVV